MNSPEALFKHLCSLLLDGVVKRSQTLSNVDKMPSMLRNFKLAAVGRGTAAVGSLAGRTCIRKKIVNVQTKRKELVNNKICLPIDYRLATELFH